MTNWKLSLVSYLEKNQDRLFLGMVGVILFVKILLKILSVLPKVDWSSFLVPPLATTLLVVVLLYIGLLILACFLVEDSYNPGVFYFLNLALFSLFRTVGQ